jgi:hypothetical protein
MMAQLESLINKNKYLKAKYEGKGVDLERDASRPAKPFGYRFTGKDNYGVPTKEQIRKGMKDGSVDYEGRPNRSDKTPKKQYKLAHGGDVDNENAEMVLSKAKELKHHADELKNVVKPNSKVEAWEVAKMERAATDASDVTHYEDGKKMYMAKGGFVGKGELVWRKLSDSKKMEFLNENFTPQITPKSQEKLVGKSWNFLPKNVKIKFEAKYANEEEFLTDGDFLSTDNELNKGVIMYFSHRNGIPKYIYKPLTMNKEEFDKWEIETMDFYQSPEQNLIWIQNIYWKIEEFSCVLVPRNHLWFECAIYDIKRFWNLIEHERENGFEHRKGKKRIKTQIVEETQCYIDV